MEAVMQQFINVWMTTFGWGVYGVAVIVMIAYLGTVDKCKSDDGE